MLGFVTKTIEAIFGKKSDKDLKALDPYVDKVHQAHERIAPLSNDELRGKTQEFRQNLKAHLADIDTEIQTLKDKAVGENKLSSNQREDLYFNIDKLEKERNKQLEQFLDQILPEAFAVVKETAKRFKENDFVPATANDLDRNLAVNAPHITITNDQVSYATEWMAAGGKVEWNMVHYDVQLIGGVVLHQGKIAEMATGEGKTLVATLPAYLNGLTGEGVHVITVNNYLARRDCEWMAPLLNFLGLTVDCIDRYKPHSAKRLKAYRADITYGTNNEFGFDYLRDNMVRNPEEIVQRKLHYTMIDEVDSVLIDDARTPLIISGPVERGEEQEFDSLKPRIERLVKVQRELTRKYLVEAKKAFAEGNTKPEEGGGGLALLRASRGLPRNKPLIKFLGESGNKTVLLDTENYYLQEQAKRMPEVDKELYFVIEEKNNQVHLTERGVELITKSGEDAGFFIMPDVGGEIAKLENNTELSPEELRTQKDQLMQDFAIKSERLHSVQQLLKAYTLFEMDVEYILEDGKVKIVDESTGRVMEGRRYSDGLHQAIEAKENVKVEAATQTFATVTLQNFFRMYHKLAGMTGTAETEAGEFWDIYGLDVVVIPTNKPIARADENDLVYRTTREKYNAVIDHVIALSKAGQPVLVGTTSVDTSEKLSRLLQRKGIDHNVLNAKQHAREADIVTNAGQPGAVTIATNMAGRGTDIKLGTGVIQSGGLAIVGTERHESRRVDRQLRGRAGRQGDPGSSQFFVSLEDNLMRIFGSERVAKVMDKIGFQEGEVIQHRMITKSIENAQKKVEENHFGTRKRLLDYDEVMNAQRNVIYAKRRHALYGERLSVDLSNAYHDLCEEIVIQSRSENDYEGFKLDVIRHFSTDTAIDETIFSKGKEANVIESLFQEASNAYARKSEAVVKIIKPFIDRTYMDNEETAGDLVVPIPFTDGKKLLHVACNLQEAYTSGGKSVIRELEKIVSLSFIDDAWKTHLREMDELKQSVQTQVYAQKDPLLIYKGSAFNLFADMIAELNRDITTFLYRASVPVRKAEEVKGRKKVNQKTDLSRMKTGRNEDTAEGGNKAKTSSNTKEKTKPETYRRTMPKVGRNEPCPCGSGKKYKSCHGKKQAQQH